ncbi:MAG TPA: HIT domain-containing protein [Candidatus Omnitrophica bacterium]|nr:HIT domain-containing protein [Candidatus Omnitrophota bacterium]
MNKLWAPWRITYIKNHLKNKHCLFCRAKKIYSLKTDQKKYDRKNFVVFRSKLCFVMINLFPYNNGHLMVTPYRHVKNFSDLKDSEILDLIKTTSFMQTTLTKTLNSQGYNIGINLGKIAGAGIPGHMHIHIVPRWIGDTNFMPVISKTKVISQSLKSLYDALNSEIIKTQKLKNRAAK